MVKFAGRIIHGGDGIGSCISGSRQVRNNCALNGESEIRGVGERAAGALSHDRVIPRCGVGSGGEEDGSARASRDAEGTWRIRDNARGQTGESDLDAASEAIERIDGQIDGGARGVLLEIDGILREANRKIGLRRRRRRLLNG